MEENLVYFKINGLGSDVKDKIILACKPEEIEQTKRVYEGKGYTLEECECPKDATIHTLEEPPIGAPNPYTMHPYYMFNPWENVKSTIYDGPNCSRCANRFRHTEWCDNHYKSKNCYRFKLDR